MNVRHAHTSHLRLILALLIVLMIAPAASAEQGSPPDGSPPAAQLTCGPLPEVVRPPGARLQVQLLDAEGAPLAEREIHWERPATSPRS